MTALESNCKGEAGQLGARSRSGRRQLTRLESNITTDGALVVLELGDDGKQSRGEGGEEDVREGGEARQAELARDDAVVGALAFGEEVRRGGDELGEAERGGESCSLVVLLELWAREKRSQLGDGGRRVKNKKALTIFLAASSLASWNFFISSSCTLSWMNLSNAALLSLFFILLANFLFAT